MSQPIEILILGGLRQSTVVPVGEHDNGSPSTLVVVVQTVQQRVPGSATDNRLGLDYDAYGVRKVRLGRESQILKGQDGLIRA
eukprot:2830249-Pyramimonas_sp.AAC.1